MTRTRRLWTLAVVLACLARDAGALAAGVPAPQGALLVLKVLTYDYNFADRKKTPVVLVLHKVGDSASTSDADAMVAALNEATSSYQVSGVKLTVKKVGISSAQDADMALAGGAAAVYVCAGLEPLVADISLSTAAHDILSFTSQASIFDAGVGIGLLLDGTKPRLAVNLPETRQEGAAFAASFLSVADVRR